MNGIIISGISGKMGKYIYEKAAENDIRVVAGVDKNISCSCDCPVYKNFDEINEIADVIIDFSSPDNLNSVLDFAFNNKIPVVIGTTGYNCEQEKQILKYSESIPIFKSYNMSFGVNVLIKICGYLSALLQGYDIEIIDRHHRQKKDSPSGTTYMFLKSICDAKNKDESLVFGRKGKTKRGENEIGVHSVRGGGIVGEHEITFISQNECITLTHTAFSKELFADGAIKAAKFLIGKAAKLYTMDDMLVLLENRNQI